MTYKNGKAGILIIAFICLAGAATASQFSVSAVGNPQIRLTTNRMVILDDPSGWDGGAPGITDRGDQWSGESTTIRWYVLLLNSSGEAAGNITVSSQILFPNGSVAIEKTNATNSFGIAAFDQDMDRWLRLYGSGSEGVYTIIANASMDNTSLSGSYNFTYDEWGCGSSGSGCHASQYWGGTFDSAVASTFAAGSVQNSPYMHAWDNFHSSTTGHGAFVSFGPGECLTCHRGYDGNSSRNHSSRVQVTPQYPAGIHAGKVRCTGCHSTFGTGEMPIYQCYDCHPIKNDNLTVKNFVQTATSGFSYHPLTNSSIMAHTPGNDIPCIMCHNGMHNVSKPYNATGTSNSFTEYQQCTACHTARSRHNDSVSCTVCHSQDAQAIKILAQNATYIQGVNSPDRGNCTSCHQNSSFLDALLSQPMAGNFTGEAPQVPNPLNHSNDTLAGMKWNATPGYWTNGTNGSAQLSSCRYCHGDTLHKTSALGRPSLWSGNNIVNSTTSFSANWCPSCHYQGYVSGGNTYNDMVNTFKSDNLPIPPEITGNSTYGANQSAPSYFNHSNITSFNDATCRGCHGRLAPGNDITGLLHNVAVGIAAGGPDCALCHDVNGVAPKRINFSAFKEGVHRNLNSFAANNTSLSDTVDKACWACHGNGSEPSGGHPSNYRTPKNCNNNDCHTLAQSPYNEPMVYSHFQNASRNDNPSNGTNYNITTSVQCQICHINSVAMTDNYPQVALVSHYAIKDNLIDSFNCTYCHRVKNNSEVWGNATLIYKNTTSLVELDKERNKLTAYEGESIYLGDGYSMKVVEISLERSEALIQLFKNNDMVDETSLQVGVPYNYEEYITIDNGTFRTPIIILNATSIFKGASQSLIQFRGFRTARVHAETNSTSCLACHLYRYSTEKSRYMVIDRETRDIPDHDIIYYTNVLVDFVSENKSKVYYNDDNYVLSQINTDFGRFLTSPTTQKYLREGETWNLGENVSLKLNAVATDSKQALLALMINDSVVEDWAVTSGSAFSYTRPIRYKGYEDTNVTIFSATLASISQANPNFVILKDVVAISPSIKQTTANTTIFGFNTSWLFPNDTFIVGKVPENFHQPSLYTDQRTWADCVRCHDTSNHLDIPNVDAISSRLGKHYRLNLNASNISTLSDPIDKACWACHTPDGNAPTSHVPTYFTPRNCKSCHVYQENPDFGAINISDEPHALQQNCPTCHIQNTHTLVRFDVSPVINKISLSKTQVGRNETIQVIAEAVSGYKFKIRAAEYFIDEMGVSGNGTPMEPVDGKFDSQTKDITSDINVSGISPGEHTLYIHAMERSNRWGEFSSVNFTKAGDPQDPSEKTADISPVVLIFGFAAAYLVVSRRVKRMK